MINTTAEHVLLVWDSNPGLPVDESSTAEHQMVHKHQDTETRRSTSQKTYFQGGAGRTRFSSRGSDSGQGGLAGWSSPGEAGESDGSPN